MKYNDLLLLEAGVDLLVDRMRQAGLTQIGDGGYADVFETKDGSVAKVAMDRCYMYFLNLVKENESNPHFPRIRKVVRFKVDQYKGAYLVKMEKLQELPKMEYLSNFGFHAYKRLYFDDPISPAVQRMMIQKNPGINMQELALKMKQLADEWEDQNVQFAKALMLVYTTAGKSACDLDMESRNIMKRGDTWVITDPFKNLYLMGDNQAKSTRGR